MLNPFRRIDQHLMDDSDLGGPILFAGLFGFFLLFSGNLHFGYIYGLAALGSISLHFIISLMTPLEDGDGAGPSSQAATPYGAGHQPPSAHHGGMHPNELSSTLTYFRSASVLGYCLLPLTVTSLLGIVMPMDTPLGIVMTSAAIMWCTYSASGIFCAVGRMRGMRGLVAYPLALFYVGFGIMSIFSSRKHQSSSLHSPRTPSCTQCSRVRSIFTNTHHRGQRKHGKDRGWRRFMSCFISKLYCRQQRPWLVPM